MMGRAVGLASAFLFLLLAEAASAGKVCFNDGTVIGRANRWLTSGVRSGNSSRTF